MLQRKTERIIGENGVCLLKLDMNTFIFPFPTESGRNMNKSKELKQDNKRCAAKLLSRRNPNEQEGDTQLNEHLISLTEPSESSDKR